MKEGSFGRKVAGVLLAAGASTRMGTLKQLLPVAGRPLMERTLNAALKSRLNRLVLVLGHRADDILRELGTKIHDSKLTVVHNRQYPKGISTSLVAGVKAIENTHDHAMILLADMPFVGSDVIDSLITAYLKSRSPIGAVRVSERATHPVVFRRDLFPEIKGLTGDTGARSLLGKYHDRICFITPQRGYDHRDIDTQEDYRKFQSDLKERKKEWPTS